MAEKNDADLGDILQRLVDRQEIEDLHYRYTRGLDRRDAAMAASCFHDDALEEHGPFFGRIVDFLRGGEVMEAFAEFDTMLHFVNNQLIEFVDENTAHGEALVYVLMTRKDGDRQVLDSIAGRYLSRFERRDGVWKIGRRTFLADLGESRQFAPDYPHDLDQYPSGKFVPDDLVYHWSFRTG